MGTATQIDDSSGDGGMTRRELFRRTGTIGAGAAATVTVGSRVAPRYSPVGRAAAAAPLIPIGVIGGAAAVKYATGKTVGEHILGDNRDYSGYTGADALHLEIERGATQMKSADERVMTSIENNINNSENVALPKGKNAVIEKMNAEASESDAQTAMQNAIDDYFSTIEQNVVTHYKSQVNQLRHLATRVNEHSNLNPTNVFEVNMFDGWQAVDDVYQSIAGWHMMLGQDYEYNGNQITSTTKDYTLLNGDTVSVPIADDSEGDWGGIFPDNSLAISGSTMSTDGRSPPVMWTRVQPKEKSSPTRFMEYGRYYDALAAIKSKRDDVNAQLSGFVSDVYSAYDPGDIPTEDLIDPVTAATEMNQDYDDRGFHSASAAIMGIPTSAEFSADLEIVSDEADDGVWEVNADIFTAHTPTDADGNETGFETGQTYQPSNWSEPLFIAYSYEDEVTGETTADFTQIESEFTIVRVTDVNGNEVDNFKPESQNNQTADVASLEEELAQIREAQVRMQEDAEEETEDEGFTMPPIFGDSGGGGILLVGAAVLAFLGLQDNN